MTVWRGLERRLALATLAALALGLAGGLTAYLTDLPALKAIGSFVEPAGALWAAALRMCVVPLVVSLLITAVASGFKQVGRVGALTASTFFGLLVLGSLYNAVLAPLVVRPISIPAESLASLADEAPPLSVASGTTGQAIGTWVRSLLPTNPVQAAAEDNLLPLIIFSILFGLAATRIDDSLRLPLFRLFDGIAAAMLVLIRGVMLCAPLGVFGLTFPLAANAGLDAAGFILYFVVAFSAVLAGFIAILYVVTVVLTGTPLRLLARAMAGPNAVAIGTRSSLATLPALLESATTIMRLPASVSGFVFPLAGAIFKPNQPITSPFKLIFLAHVFGIPLTGWDVALFMALTIVLSVAVAGIPSGGGLGPMGGLYLAFGLPFEAVVLLEAVDLIPDLFQTVLNVTGYLSAATIVARLSGDWIPAARPATVGADR